MKKTNYLIAGLSLILMLGILTSCGGDKKKDEPTDKLGKMELVIPDALKDNPEMVEYVEGMTGVVDDYAVLMDEMVNKMGPFKGKNFDELKLGQQIKFTALISEVGIKSAPIMVKWSEFEMQRSVFDGDLTDDELLALETVWTRFEERMKQIEEKHSDFFNEDSEE